MAPRRAYRIEDFGKMIGITRQVLINDDLDASPGCRPSSAPPPPRSSVATDNTLIGVAVLPVGTGAEEMIGRVRLNGSF